MSGAIYSAEFTIVGVNAVDGVLFNLKTVATERAKVLQVGFFVESLTTNPPQFGLKRMLAVGTGAITTTPPGVHDAAEGANTALLETAWATTSPPEATGTLILTLVDVPA